VIPYAGPVAERPPRRDRWIVRLARAIRDGWARQAELHERYLAELCPWPRTGLERP